MKLKILTLIFLNFQSCLLITKQIDFKKNIETQKAESAIMSLNYIHQINGNQIEITSKEIGEIKNSIIIGLEKNYLQFNKGNFEKIVEIKIKINERKNTFISNLSAYTYSIIPHYLTLELEYVLIIRNKDGEEIKSNVFKSESLGINSIMLFPVSIIYDPRKVLSNYLINVTDLLINYKE